MKKLRNIFAALSTLRRIPSADILAAWEIVKEQANVNIMAVTLIDQVIDAVVAIAKDDEDKAAAPGKDGKTAA